MRLGPLLLFVCLGLVAGPSNATAQGGSVAMPWFVTVRAGWILPTGDDTSANDAEGTQLSLNRGGAVLIDVGKVVSNNIETTVGVGFLNPALVLTRSPAQASLDGLRLSELHAGINYDFRATEMVGAYIGAFVSVANKDISEGTLPGGQHVTVSTGAPIGVGIGFGVRMSPTQGSAVSLDISARWNRARVPTDVGSRLNFSPWMLLVGFTVSN